MPYHHTPRLLSNLNEQDLVDLAHSSGWWTTKRGWPDFVCGGPNGQIIAVEVKPRRKNGRLGYLKREQAMVMKWLTAHGIRCFVSDGEKLEVFDPAKHCRLKDAPA